MDFDEAMAAEGFVRETHAPLHTAATMAGSATFRLGPARVELSSASLVYSERHGVSFYVAMRPEWVICAIVVDRPCRRSGFGNDALEAIVRVAQALKVERLWLEPFPMRKEGPGADKESLVAWYRRHGFTPADEGAHVMERKL